MLSFSKDQLQDCEPFTEEEKAHLQELLNSEYTSKPQELSDLIDHKIENESAEREEFMGHMREQFHDEDLISLRGATEINRILKERLYPTFLDGFMKIK